MANLRVDKITSTETFETTGSVQFGNDNALKIAANSGFDLTSNDFTMECWVYMNSVESFQTLLLYTVDGTEDDTVWQFDITSTQLRFVGYVSNSSEVYGSNFSFGSGTWYHVAATRTNDLVRLFVDGDLIGTHHFTSTLDTEASAELNIGYRNNQGTMDREVFGHLSNIRVIKGKALYTANFKPPMRELEVTPETTLLCCQSKTDASLEKTSKTITVLGDAVASELTPGILTPIVKAGGGSAITGSVEFDGTGDYLTVPNTEDLRLADSDFTVEAYINFSNGATSNGVIVALWDNTNNQRSWNFYFDRSGNDLYFAGSTNGSAGNNSVTASIDIEDNNWYHVAACRSGSTIRLFVNGVELASNTSIGTYYDNTTDLVTIGAQNHDNNTFHWKGFISNLRIVKGTALYTEDFIPPTRELKKVPGTVLLACQDPDNPLTEATGKTITGHGDLNQSYGTDLVTNGQFTADSDWTKGTQWTISGGSASITDSPDRGSDSLLTQDASSWIQEGQVYRVAVDWSFSSGDFDVRLGGDSDYTEYSINSFQSSPYFFNIEAGGTNDNLDIIANQHAVGDINSISIEKLPPSRTGSNFTPQVGDDRKVTFEGVTKINSDAYFYLPTGDTVTRDSRSGYGNRGLFSLGAAPSASNIIEFVNIASTGNSQNFGDLTYKFDGSNASCSSSTRGIFAGGRENPSPGGNINHINYVTIASTGDAKDFGDLTQIRRGITGHSSSIRGIFAAGRADPGPNPTDTIDFITIASTGNALDFGNLITGRRYSGSTSSSTRGLVAGGADPGKLNSIEYITIPSKGNALDFGDLNNSIDQTEGNSNGVRGIFGGGGSHPNYYDAIDYVTIATTGNAKDFGDLLYTRVDSASASNCIRGLFAGGHNPTKGNEIQYVNISSMGNAFDFGNLSTTSAEGSGCSDSHGGLG